MELQRPVVMKPKKQKKRRYSRGLGDLQKTARGFSKLSARSARSVAKGFDTFYTASDSSSQKKRDGALRDLGKNLGKATSKSLKTSSRIPNDVGKILNTRSARRTIRRQIRLAAIVNKRFGIR